MSMTAPAKRRYVDTKTRYQGVYARHKLSCGLAVGGRRCTCRPSYWGKVWDSAAGRHRKTEFRSLIAEAKSLRDDLLARTRTGTVIERRVDAGFEERKEEFIADCKAGVVLNKKGKPYKGKAITNLDSSLNRLPSELREKEFGAVTQADFQNAVDDFRREELSGSRISAIVNAARSFYRWGVDRGKVSKSPPDGVRLPVVENQEMDRVATPSEFAHLLEQLEPRDAILWALAGYGTARAQEIQALDWVDVDFELDFMFLAEDDEARKSDAARRPVPLVRQLRRRLYAEWMRQGKPKGGKVCPPRNKSRSGLISLGRMRERATKRWEEAALQPIGLQESRHTAATWMDHAGIPPKVASVIMGHKAPRRQLHPDAAPITQRRYTHVLDGELERARDRLNLFLVDREEEEAADFKARPAA
jgi:integrase